MQEVENMTTKIKIYRTKKYQFEKPIVWEKEEDTGDWVTGAPFNSFMEADVAGEDLGQVIELLREDIEIICDIYLPCTPETCTEGAMRLRDKILEYHVSERGLKWLRNLKYLTEAEKEALR